MQGNDIKMFCCFFCTCVWHCCPAFGKVVCKLASPVDSYCWAASEELPLRRRHTGLVKMFLSVEETTSHFLAGGVGQDQQSSPLKHSFVCVCINVCVCLRERETAASEYMYIMGLLRTVCPPYWSKVHLSTCWNTLYRSESLLTTLTVALKLLC